MDVKNLVSVSNNNTKEIRKKGHTYYMYKKGFFPFKNIIFVTVIRKNKNK